jgi:hypothetical protein
VTALALAGAGVGLGIWLVTLALRARPSLAEVGSRLEAEGRATGWELDRRSPLEQAVIESGGRLLGGLGMDPAHRVQDLRITRRTPEQHIGAKLAWAGGLSVSGLLAGFAFLFGTLGGLGVILGAAGGAATMGASAAGSVSRLRVSGIVVAMTVSSYFARRVCAVVGV